MRQFGKRFCDVVLRSLVLTVALVVALLQPVDSSADTSQKRKKVAVVLSGGGAKGMAHIGVLHVLERAGIPVDIVTGTSMGSIVGGLYSIGYSASQLDSMVRVQDWTFLLSDKEEAHSQLLYNRKWQNTYMLSKTITLKNKKVTSEHGGFIEGRNLRNLFQNMAQGYNDSIDFNLLPIPFACVATDIITNTEYVFHSGVLAEAMRSSMAIPGVFSPIRKGDMVLVDGGLRNNFPVDVALAMGADVVIGVTVQGAPKTAADMKTTADVLSQIVDVNCKNKYDDNLKKTNVAIRVNTKGYSSAAFNAAAIDTLIRRGEEAAMAKWDELLALRKMIGIDTTFISRHNNADTLKMYPKLGARQNSVNDSVKHYSYEMKSETVAPVTTKHPSVFLAALGVRFDTEEIVALQLNGTLSPKNSPWNFGTTLRLGKRIMARGDIVYKPLKSGSMRFSYMFRHNDMNIYEEGSRTYNVTYNQHTVDIAPMNFNIRNFALAIGARFDYYAYNELLSSSNEQATNLPVRDEHLVSYYATLSYNSENKWLFPTRGACFDAHFRYNTDNFVNYGDRRGFSELSASWRMAFPLSSRFTLQPMLYGRLLLGGDIPICRSNMMGGNTFAHYVEQQVPFIGVGNIEFADNTLLAIQLLSYQRIADNNYVSLGFSTLRNCEKLSQTFDSSPRYGAQLGYTYTSLFGPLGAQLGWSNLTHSPYFYISLGFDF